MPQWRKLHTKIRESLDTARRAKGFRPRRCYNRLIRGLLEPDKAYIYGLFDPRTDALRYIGKTCVPHKRLHLHLSAARRQNKSLKAIWMRELMAQDLRPKFTILDCVAYGLWPLAERLWMQEAKDAGCQLLNSDMAGGGP